MIDPIHFIHIPKTAGSSVRAWLKQTFAEAELCPARDWDEMTRLGAARGASYKVYSGHYGPDLSDFLGKGLVRATVLRLPADRTASHYQHVARDTGHPRHFHVRGQSFEDFVLDPLNWPMIENFQARYLLPTPVSFRALDGRLDDGEIKLRSVSVLSEDARYLYDKAYAREASIAALAKIDVVGTTDRLDDFLNRLSDLAAPGRTRSETPRENVAPAAVNAVSSLSDKALEQLEALTTIDTELYKIACERADCRAGA